MYKVSIIIPVYNVAPYIKECLRSVMRQTYKGTLECLVVDDCGTDASIEIAERVIGSYNGPISFHIIHHERNRGLSAARNTGLSQAKGEFIYYLDSDDEITEDCIEKLMTPVLQNPDIEIVQGNANRYSHRHSEPLVQSNKEIRLCYYHERLIPVTAWNKLCKRSFLQRNQLLFKEGLLWDDSHWLFFVLKYVTNVFFVSDVTYLYKRRPSSIVTGTDKRTYAKHRAVFFNDVLTNLTPHDERSELKYFITEFSHQYSKFVRELPEYRDLFKLFWEKAKEHKAYSLRVRLMIGYILGLFKWGWLLSVLYKRVIHPSLIIDDLRRICRGY